MTYYRVEGIQFAEYHHFSLKYRQASSFADVILFKQYPSSHITTRLETLKVLARKLTQPWLPEERRTLLRQEGLNPNIRELLMLRISDVSVTL